LVVHTSSIDGILEEPEDLLPGWNLSSLGVDEAAENLLSSFQISIGELVVLDPTLRNELASLLDQSVEPREQEHQRQLVLVLRRGRGRNHLLEGSLQVIADTRGSLVSNLQTGLEQNGGELNVRLRSQPESELFVRLEHLEFFLEHRKPRRNQVKVLETDPFSFKSRLLDGLDRRLVGATTHSNFVESVSADSGFSELLQFSTRIRSR